MCVFYYITRVLFLHPGHAQCACTRARHSPCGRWNRSVLPAAPGVSPPAAAIRSPFIIPQICSWLTASQYLFVCVSLPAQAAWSQPDGAGRSGEAGPRCHRLTSPAGLTSHASVIVNISTSPCVNDAPIVCHASSSSLSFLWGLS